MNPQQQQQPPYAYAPPPQQQQQQQQPYYGQPQGQQPYYGGQQQQQQPPQQQPMPPNNNMFPATARQPQSQSNNAPSAAPSRSVTTTTSTAVVPSRQRLMRPPFVDPITNIIYDVDNPEYEGWLTKQSMWLKVRYIICYNMRRWYFTGMCTVSKVSQLVLTHEQQQQFIYIFILFRNGAAGIVF
jgi:hypothetical protein